MWWPSFGATWRGPGASGAGRSLWAVGSPTGIISFDQCWKTKNHDQVAGKVKVRLNLDRQKLSSQSCRLL
ncbi:unnamed protein product [Leptosia nina]|uniref:Uncharacterized protein n=1 Tax=Leptosia nina TaxID=320188 RepID=A0AAV1JR04_9NEOP